MARLRTAEADVAQRRAELAAARLSLGYTTVTAPISGRAGRAEVTEGALVSGGAATLLTRIEQIDPIYANFSQSSSDVLALRDRIASGALRRRPRADAGARSCSRTARAYRMLGKLDFIDLASTRRPALPRCAPSSPTRSARSCPASSCACASRPGCRPKGLRIPQRAVTLTPTAANVMVVGAKDIVEVGR